MELSALCLGPLFDWFELGRSTGETVHYPLRKCMVAKPSVLRSVGRLTLSHSQWRLRKATRVPLSLLTMAILMAWRIICDVRVATLLDAPLTQAAMRAAPVCEAHFYGVALYGECPGFG